MNSNLYQIFYATYAQWTESGHAKIVLQATEEEMRLIIDNPANRTVRHIIDEGRTQIKHGSLTVLGFFPCLGCDETVTGITKNFKLY
jgi:peptidyl-tRNA hydrolase